MSKHLADIIIQQSASADVELRQNSQECKLAQQKFLFQHIKHNAESFFGQEHRFSSVTTAQDFNSQVPIRGYEDHRPYINKIIAGEKKILSIDEPIGFNMTSGTTSEPKFIPVTKEMIQNNRQVLLHWLAEIAKDHPEAFGGNILGLVSPAVEGLIGSFPYGNATGNLYRHLPKYIHDCYAIPDSVSEIKDYELRYFIAVRFALEKNISLLVTPNPSTFLRFSNVASQQAERLIQAIHDGSLGVELPPSDQIIANKFKASLHPNPARAKILQEIFLREQAFLPKSLWPNLSMIGCWMGGSVGLQISNLYPYYGDNIVFRDPGYLASEGRMSLPLRDNTPSGVLCLNTNYYEFVPEELNPLECKQTLLAHELEIRKCYNIIITNKSGLYRYDMNDIVEVTGFYYNCPEIMFLRKSRDMTNIMGEKLHLNHCLAAMRNLSNLILPGHLIQFAMWPNVADSRYELAIELDQEQINFDGKKYIDIFDQQLQLENIEYASKRKSLRLQAPLLHLMQMGWSEDRKKQALLSGKKDIQYKWISLRREKDPEDHLYIIKTYKASQP